MTIAIDGKDGVDIEDSTFCMWDLIHLFTYYLISYYGIKLSQVLCSHVYTEIGGQEKHEEVKPKNKVFISTPISDAPTAVFHT